MYPVTHVFPLAGGSNLYAYVGGNPVNANDPLGLCPTGYKWKPNGQTGQCVLETPSDNVPGNPDDDEICFSNGMRQRCRKNDQAPIPEHQSDMNGPISPIEAGKKAIETASMGAEIVGLPKGIQKVVNVITEVCGL